MAIVRKRPKVTKVMREALTEYRVVKVLWVDHNSVDEWVAKQDHDGIPTLVSTIGFLVLETQDTLSVSSTIDCNGNSCATMNIIKALVVSMKTIKV